MGGDLDRTKPGGSGNPQFIILFDGAGLEPGAHLSCHYATTATQVSSVGSRPHDC